jgi:tRNA(fMet)-specific endonuclease VapC
MNFLVDSDVCSAYMRGEARVSHKFMQHGGQIALSAIVVGELSVIAEKHGQTGVYRQRLEELIGGTHLLQYDLPCARRFGEVRWQMMRMGLICPPIDLMIAATAMAHDLILVTHNTRHFEKVPGLRIDDWLAD